MSQLSFRMKPHCCLLVVLVCALLFVPADTWGLRRAWRRLTRGVRKAVCKIKYHVACPVAVGTLTGGVGAALGKAACHVKGSSCKRTFNEEEELWTRGEVKVPFDPDFDDYDHDQDGYVDFEEFVETIGLALPLKPEELQAPFNDADIDKDGLLSKEEFEAAPFDFENGNDNGDDDDDTQ